MQPKGPAKGWLQTDPGQNCPVRLRAQLDGSNIAGWRQKLKGNLIANERFWPWFLTIG
jgi:hypothetical protein